MWFGVAIGAVLGIIVGMFMGAFLAGERVSQNGGTLRNAQTRYNECIIVGAPPDNCARTYLIPEGK